MRLPLIALKARVREALAPTVQSSLSEAEVRLAQKPRTGSLLLMAGAVGVSADYVQSRAATVGAVPPTTGR